MEAPKGMVPSMKTNQYIADQLFQMSKQHAADKRRKDAYMKASVAVRNWNKPITSGKEAMKSINGVGKSSAEAIDQILQSGYINILEQRSTEEKNKQAVIDMFMTLHGVGIVKATEWYNAGYRTMEEIVDLYQKGSLTAGQNLGLLHYNDLQQRIPRAEMDLWDKLLHALFDGPGAEFVITGSYRRMLQNSGDVDFIMKSELKSGAPLTLADVTQFLDSKGIVLGNYTPKASVKSMLVVRFPARVLEPPSDHQFLVRQMDIHMTEPKLWPFSLLYFTGSKNFNIKMRRRAEEFGLSLSQFGFIDLQKNPWPPINSPIVFKTEQDVFEFLKIKYLEPWERTDSVELTFTGPVSVVSSAALSLTEIKGEEKHIGKWYSMNNRAGEASLLVYIEDLLFEQLKPTRNYFLKIAAFDMDHTLVTNKGPTPFTINADDLILIPGRREKLKQLINEGYVIVVFSNQLAKTDSKRSLNIAKISKDVELLNLPMIVFAAFGEDEYRKPNQGMWMKLDEMVPGIDYSQSFFSGDAAGRENKDRRDFSDSDLQFAKGKGVKFFVPEEIFGH